MKTIIIAFAITSVFAACNSKSSETKDVVGVDTTGMYKNNMIADTARVEPVLAPGSVKKVVETRSPDGSVTTTTTTSAAPRTSTRTRTQSSTSGNSTASTSPATTTTQKKGWSSRAKGAVIGGVGGAVVGAAVSKKKGTGAVIGGVVGAAGGYIIGNEKDKKTGR
ncbi:MAG: YMGG-like glycine zipper-containing protein [Ginsengibacter sp.]